MKHPRWTAVSESNFPWEREALDWLRERLPERDPWHVWSNFEFIDDEGKVNEVDALVLSPAGIFLVEIKSRPGVVSGDVHTWSWHMDGRDYLYDNPLILANRKAKRLASVLRRQPAVAKARARIPFIEPLIFLSATSLNCKLTGPARTGVLLRGSPDAAKDDGIVARLSARGAYPLDAALLAHDLARVCCRAIMEAGVRPSNKHRKVGDYQLGSLISEGENYQDWEGSHVAAGVRRRVRIYGYALAASHEARLALVRQATREFQILEGVDHPGILRVRDFKESELGPALLFDYEPQSRRLDFLLREQGSRLSLDQRLSILRQLAETLKYAHQKKLYHRALSPQSILVRNAAESLPRLQIMNWQLAARDGSTAGTLMRTVGTRHVEDYVEDPAKVYLAPESQWDGATAGPHLDVFSLGAIAWQLFCGEPPAADSVALQQKLRAGNGLRISDALDGAGKALQELIQYSTCPDVSGRLHSMEEFLEYLELVEDELTAPAEEATVDPANARQGDRIEGGFTVLGRLGKGSTADVLLVRRDRDEEEWVLKVASDASHNERLKAEGETLARLRHANIVEGKATLSVAGRTALLMKSAGKHSLAYQLSHEARPSLDLVRRFGDELLQAAVFLEDQGVHHRDIKPDNIGVVESSHSGKLRLVLYDFSLSRTAIDNIQAGTKPYLDPFLCLRKPPRWDTSAERFALAMTLYELVTGRLPYWGDGVSDPSMLAEEVSLDATLFDPNLRDSLAGFFGKALRRDFRERFDNAEDMLRAWRKVFERAEAVPVTDPFEVVARRVHADTAMGELGYSVEAQNALDRMGIHKVRELLAVDRVRFRYLKAVGDKIRKEIRLKAKLLAKHRPDLAPARPSVLDAEQEAEAGAPTSRSIDELVAQLLPRRVAEEDRPDENALAIYLGLDVDGLTASLWPSLGEAAEAAGVTRPALTHALVEVRARWLKSPSMTELREELAALMQANGGVLTAAEAASSLLASHGSIEQDDALRVRLAAAVLRAAIEAESKLAAPRCQIHPAPCAPLIAATVDHVDYAIRLGVAADELVADASGALATPRQVVERLTAVDRPSTVAELSSQRLVKLAANCASTAAVSSLMELYPRGMAAQRTIKLARGSLNGPRMLTEQQIAERVLGRYPAAEALPGRPALDALLTAAGSDLVYLAEGAAGAGYYSSHKGFGPSAGTTTYLHRLGTRLEAVEEASEEVAGARQFEERLNHAARAGGFLALSVAPRLTRHAEAEIIERFTQPHGFRRVSLDQLILSCLKEEARVLRVDWQKVMEADQAGPGGPGWNNFMRLAGRARPHILASLLGEKTPLLLVHPGLLARLDLMDILTELQGAAGRADGIAAVWLLAPMAAYGLPTLDGVPIPVISSAQWARIPEAWLQNIHRGGGRREDSPLS